MDPLLLQIVARLNSNQREFDLLKQDIFAYIHSTAVPASLVIDTPPVALTTIDQANVTVSLAVADQNDANQASTSTCHKRKSTIQTGNKQKKAPSVVTPDSKRHICKYAECGKSFARDFKLAEHERIHLNVKPFSCTWLDCGHSAVRKDNLVEHVRTKHFKLPKLMKDQTRLNIVDNRNPEDYIRVDNQLLERRLE